jgi:hypothetical protein
MDSVGLRRAPAHRAILGAAVVAHGSARLARDEIAPLRRRPEPMPEGWPPITPTALRASDDQTVAAVAAVRSAIARTGEPAEAFEGWGVLSAPRFLGRSNLVAVLDRFRSEGVWGVTPHLIPHFALHSQSGTLSLVLGCHGPNLGIGGGLFAASEGVLTALTWLASGVAPGVWLVLTGWSPEYLPDLDGEPREPTRCEALALALTNAEVSDRPSGRLMLEIVEAEVPLPPSPPTPEGFAAKLESALASPASGPRLIGHSAHDGRGYPRPHVLRGPSRDVRRATVGTDAAGVRLIELAAPGVPGRGETT